MTTVSFNFDPWDEKEDVPLERPGTQLGYAVVHNNVEIGDTPNVRLRRQDTLIGPAVDGVVGLLAGCLEWMRQYGFSAEDVRQKVEAYKKQNRATPAQQHLLESQRSIHDIADGNNIADRLDPNAVIG